MRARAHGLVCTVSHSRRGDAVGGSAASGRNKSSHTDECWHPSITAHEQYDVEVPDNCGRLQYGVVNLKHLVSFTELG